MCREEIVYIEYRISSTKESLVEMGGWNDAAGAKNPRGL